MTTEITLRANQGPAQNKNQQLLSLASSRNVALRRENKLKPVYDQDGAFISNKLVVGRMKAHGQLSDVQGMADEIRATLSPAPRTVIEEWIAEVSVIAPARADDAMTMAMKLDAYSKRLAEYPGDIVRDVLLGTPWRFFPSWYELRQAIEVLHIERLEMLRACEQQPAPETDHASENREPRVTPDAAAEILRQAGFAPKLGPKDV